MRILLVALAVLAACTPRRVHEEPILENGDRVPDAAATATRSDAAAVARDVADRRASLAADALADCEPEVCDALARGELALGMTRAQVLAATGTTPEAWTIRDADDATVMVPASLADSPRDAVGDVVMVHLRDDAVARYSYREARGVRVVSAPADATTGGRADALAEMLVREGDELAAAGRLNEALERYDRADVLRPGDPELDYRIATVLDKQLRPVEALIRYRLFLHRLELETIEAKGDAAAKLADAIARARQRIIVLEKRTR